jgi:hypothetical protein
MAKQSKIKIQGKKREILEDEKLRKNPPKARNKSKLNKKRK